MSVQSNRTGKKTEQQERDSSLDKQKTKGGVGAGRTKTDGASIVIMSRVTPNPRVSWKLGYYTQSPVASSLCCSTRVQGHAQLHARTAESPAVSTNEKNTMKTYLSFQVLPHYSIILFTHSTHSLWETCSLKLALCAGAAQPDIYYHHGMTSSPRRGGGREGRRGGEWAAPLLSTSLSFSFLFFFYSPSDTPLSSLPLQLSLTPSHLQARTRKLNLIG